MSPSDVEVELRRWREPDGEGASSNAQRLPVEHALAYRDAGNIPDELGRSLRLVLHVGDASELSYLQQKRLLFEPDFHDAPDWRREGSKPVNVIPLRRQDTSATARDAWWEDPELAALEREWSSRGTVAGLPVPGPYRGFVYKTVLALAAAGKEITPDAVADSIARWLPPAEAEDIRLALKRAQR